VIDPRVAEAAQEGLVSADARVILADPEIEALVRVGGTVECRQRGGIAERGGGGRAVREEQRVGRVRDRVVDELVVDLEVDLFADREAQADAPADQLLVEKLATSIQYAKRIYNPGFSY
jgi:hypothetical protein